MIKSGASYKKNRCYSYEASTRAGEGGAGRGGIERGTHTVTSWNRGRIRYVGLQQRYHTDHVSSHQVCTTYTQDRVMT